MIALVFLAEQKMEIYRDSPLDTAIVFGMDMCGQLASHCAELLQTPTEKSKILLSKREVFNL